MKPDEIKAIQTRIGVEADGFWGPQSIEACKDHLRALMPKTNPWPDTDQGSLTAFYGRAGDESKLVAIESPCHMTYEGVKVKTVRCHAKVAASLSRSLAAIGQLPGCQPIVYDGCYNNRPMRGGSTPSLHARGAAIDLWADTNGNHVSWPVAATMRLDVMECFAREGWVCAGAFWGRDAMHFQATS